ncbi:hypothetical protein D3C77_240660 [compost metagenome]
MIDHLSFPLLEDDLQSTLGLFMHKHRPKHIEPFQQSIHGELQSADIKLSFNRHYILQKIRVRFGMHHSVIEHSVLHRR